MHSVLDADGDVTVFDLSPSLPLTAATADGFLRLTAGLTGSPAIVISALHGNTPSPIAAIGLSRRQALELAKTGTRRGGDRSTARIVRHPDGLGFTVAATGETATPNLTHACVPILAHDGVQLGTLDVLVPDVANAEAPDLDLLTLLAGSVVDSVQAVAPRAETCPDAPDAGSEMTASRQASSAIQASAAAIVGIDLNGTITYWNAGAERLYGYRKDEILGTPIRRTIPRSRLDEETRLLSTIAAGREVAPYESERLTREGRILQVMICAAPIMDAQGNIVGATKCIQDSTPLIQRELEAKRLARLYDTLYQLNNAIMAASVREALEQEACRILVDIAGFSLAWIGRLDPEARWLVPVAVSGHPIDYVRKISVYADTSDQGNGPSGTAFRTGQTQVSNDLLSDPATRPWHDRMRAAQLRSSAAFPIMENDRVVGVLSIYASRLDRFHADEVALLENVTRILGLRLSSLARAVEAAESQKVLAEERKFSNALVESTPGILCVFERKTLRCLRWNRHLRDVTGYSDDELRKLTMLDFFPETDHTAAQAAVDDTFRTGRAQYRTRIRAKDGIIRPYLISAKSARINEIDCFVGIGIDILEHVQAEKERRKSEDRYGRLFESAPTGIAIVDSAGIYLDANPSLHKLLGYENRDIVGKRVADFVAPADCHRIDPVITEILSGTPDRGEWEFLHRDGHQISFSSVSTRMGDGDIMVVLNDITERKAHEKKIAYLERIRSMIGGIHSAMLRRSDHDALLREACRISVEQGAFVLAAVVSIDAFAKRPQVVCVEALEGSDLDSNAAAGGVVSACDHLSLYAMRSGKSISANEALPETTAAGRGEDNALNGIRSAAAFPLWIAGRSQYALLLLASRTDAFDAEEIGLLEWMADDLSFVLDHIDTSKQLQHLTYFDPLTGLLNARGANEKIDRLAAQAIEDQRHICFLAIDLDDFSKLNDRFGRETGDRLLRAFGERLQRFADKDFTVARLGGDTFAMFGLLANGNEQACNGDRLAAFFKEPFQIEDNRIEVPFRAGIATRTDEDDENGGPVTLEHAMHALRTARNQGSQIALYSRSEEQSSTRSISLESQLHAAIENDQFVLHYQPRLDIISGEIVGAEALVRWQHPEKGLLPPADFIELAERSGLIRPLGSRIIQMVCAQQSLWRANGIRIVPIAANVSGIQLNRDDLPKIVGEALAANALEPEWLELELTESAVMQDVSRTIRILEDLRNSGIKLSLDDFGTGYSSLSYLKRLPLDRVKIDRSFITDVTRSVEDAAIALAIIAIARSLKLTSVAEGVETKAQLAFLAKNHCDEMQGYLFSPPVAADAFASFLRQNRRLDLQPSGKHGQRSVLVVDDEQSICKALSRLLRRDGYEVLTANSGEQALDLLAMHNVQVVISDQRMPGMTGTELLDKVKNLYPNTIRVVLSGYTDLNVITEAVNRGAVFRFLTKPWDDNELRDQIRNAFVHYDKHKGDASASGE